MDSITIRENFFAVKRILRKKMGLILAGIVMLIISIAPSFGPAQFGDQVIVLSREGQLMIAFLAGAIVLFITEALPIGAFVALLYTWIIFLGIVPPEEAAGLFSHDAVWFLMGSLMIATVLIKHNLHVRILTSIFKLVGNKVRNLVFGIVTFSAFTAAFIADHTVAAIMLPIILVIIHHAKKITKIPNLTKLLLFSVAYGATIGGLATPSGGGRNVIMIDFLKQYFDISITYGAWLVMALPITLILIPVIVFVLLKIFKPEISDLGEIITDIEEKLELRQMKVKEWAVLSIFAIVLFLWIFKTNLGIGVIALFGTLLYLITGLAKWRDYNQINWGIVLLYFGAIGFGTVLKSTGAATWLASKVGQGAMLAFNIDGGIPLVAMTSVFSALFSQVMANGPAVASMGPIFLEMARLTGTNPIILGIAVAIASSFAMCLVIGTPANTIIYGSGHIKAKDFLKAGGLLSLISLIVLMLVVYFWWDQVLGISPLGFH